uniref:Uncharacterized protein n=1 Tax=Cacopsylla melanoneura TaxID=428564 RepID=A0A8D9F225_9HEMI
MLSHPLVLDCCSFITIPFSLDSSPWFLDAAVFPLSSLLSSFSILDAAGFSFITLSCLVCCPFITFVFSLDESFCFLDAAGFPMLILSPILSSFSVLEAAGFSLLTLSSILSSFSVLHAAGFVCSVQGSA